MEAGLHWTELGGVWAQRLVLTASPADAAVRSSTNCDRGIGTVSGCREAGGDEQEDVERVRHLRPPCHAGRDEGWMGGEPLAPGIRIPGLLT